MFPAILIGGWALRLSAASWGTVFVAGYLLRKRLPRGSIISHISVGLAGALLQLSLPESAILKQLPASTVRPGLAVFGVIGLFALGLYGGPLAGVIGFVVAGAVLSLHFVANIPLYISFLLGTVSGIAVNHIVCALADSQTKLSRFAMTDALTGLSNRRALDIEFERYQSIAAREGNSLFLSLWDLDNLKEVNDLAGHLEGDELLRQFTHVLRSVLREGDAIFRIGGDEFCCLHMGLKDGASIMERVQALFPSVSVGFVNGSDLSLSEALDRVDGEMYQMKRRRRRRP
jgi:diguanylate cyclase (GGDEF)-like protein